MERWRIRALAACIGVQILATAPAVGTSLEHYKCLAYDASDRELYRETHYLSGVDAAHQRLVLYLCPDGKAFARKRFSDAGPPKAPTFGLDDGRSGYREGVRTAADGQRDVFVRNGARGDERHAALAVSANLVIDAGFDAFIRSQSASLELGQRAPRDFLIPSRLESTRFVVRRLADGEIDGGSVGRYRVELGAWDGFALPSMDVAYADDTRALVEYDGVANIRGNDQRHLDVRIHFQRAANAVIDAATLVRVDGMALDGRGEL